MNPYNYVALQPQYDFTYEIYNQRRRRKPARILISGEEIVKNRLRLGLTQKELADAINVKHRVVKDAEAGLMARDFDLAKKLERYFENDPAPK